MAIVQGDVKLFRLPDDKFVGSGRCAVHVPDSELGSMQYVSGTIMVNWAEGSPEDTEDEQEYRVVFEDGRQMNIVVTKHLRAEHGPEVLRFRGRSETGLNTK